MINKNIRKNKLNQNNKINYYRIKEHLNIMMFNKHNKINYYKSKVNLNIMKFNKTNMINKIIKYYRINQKINKNNKFLNNSYNNKFLNNSYNNKFLNNKIFKIVSYRMNRLN